MELYFDVGLALLLFALFMGAPFLPIFHTALDYCKSTMLTTAWYVFGVLILYYSTAVPAVFTLQDIGFPVAYAILTIILMFLFSGRWQKCGRYLMPGNNYNHEATTFYDFTPRYTFVKGLEMFFQNVVAATVIVVFYALTESVWLTGVMFATAFFCLHMPAVHYFGREWTIFILVASVVAGIVPVVLILLVPGGILLLFSFHALMYLLFLVCMRRRAMHCNGYEPL